MLLASILTSSASGILQAAGDGDRAAHRDVQVGELRPGDVGRGVDGRAGLADHHVGQRCGAFERAWINSAASASVSRLAVPLPMAITLILSSCTSPPRPGAPCCVVLRRVRVDRDRVQQLAGRVDRRHLAAGAEAGVDAHHRPLAQRRLEQQVAQVGGEDLDGVVVAELAQLAADLALDRRAQQPLVAVLDGQAHLLGSLRPRRLDPRGLDAADDGAVRRLDAHLQAAVLAPALERQPLVRLDRAQRGAEIVVDAVAAFGVGLLARPLADHEAVGGEPLPRSLPRRRIVADLLGDDVARAGQRSLDIRHLSLRYSAASGAGIELAHPAPAMPAPAVPARARARSGRASGVWACTGGRDPPPPEGSSRRRAGPPARRSASPAMRSRP